MRNSKQRSFLKWAGGKYALIESITKRLPAGPRLVEPFVGAASVFLNTDYTSYWLNDINPDLIDVYRRLQQQPEQLIEATRPLFTPEYNQSEVYYRLRTEFNQLEPSLRRASLFIYFNRHGYNGLCRYNRSGGFNVPFGRYKRPHFPEQEMRAFAAKAHRAILTCLPFEKVFEQVEQGDVVYCDPPYAPLSATASFTAYAGNGFSSNDQLKLAECANHCATQQSASVLISNHDLDSTRSWYQQATITQLNVRRTISRNGNNRGKVKELLALYRIKP
ncbi:Dam family site-specific DNA-(adenine-N6)-methyltransferase [Neiella marina]|uniref:Site-specific DNA-methyltransferase (adenine-specific) n=1 Tax=Neiella holothuriorum TaxID=2870530 RepID=A0ABS7ECH2_9GAMM|nr:Dam family site-specific DNA-(adenine-N6)-methyltransferase [Neiella holothuriorum]MBW8190015.1 Dam family site-specific DNA-(adenine-N6)-methyltransferase [Neiella holothuriorum]